MPRTPPEVLARRRGPSELRQHEDPCLCGDQPAPRCTCHPRGYLRPPVPGRRPPREPFHRRFRGRQREPVRARPGRAH
eukprot:9828636-Alexandrium_andersonii.AAC.1